MAKQVKSQPALPASKISDEGGKVVGRDLKSVNPKQNRFEPTPAEPMRQRYKMAGGC
jgi:hypothetical protein